MGNQLSHKSGTAAPNFWPVYIVVAKRMDGARCHLVWRYTSAQGLPVNSSHGHLVTRSCRHTVNSSAVNSSHTRLITQSTRHKRAHNKTTSTSGNHLQAVRRHPETVLNTDGVITAICVTLMYTADYRSRRQITLLRNARSTHHNAVKHDGQLVTRFDELTV